MQGRGKEVTAARQARLSAADIRAVEPVTAKVAEVEVALGVVAHVEAEALTEAVEVVVEVEAASTTRRPPAMAQAQHPRPQRQRTSRLLLAESPEPFLLCDRTDLRVIVDDCLHLMDGRVLRAILGH